MLLYQIDARLSNLIEVAELYEQGLRAPEIYDISPELGMLAATHIAPTGELDLDSWQDEFNSTLNDRDKKLEAICHIIQESKAAQELIKAERQRLQKRAQAKAATQERLEKMLEAALGRKKWSSPTSPLTVSFARSERVDITDPAQLPEKYLRVKQTVEPAKTEIKAAIKAGEEVPGAALGEYWGVRIK